MIEEGLDAETVESYLESLVYEVMSHIRFPMMSPSQLADLLIHPLTQKYKEFFVERMGIGMAFHRSEFSIPSISRVIFRFSQSVFKY